MDIDLNAFSLKELKDLHGQVGRAMANYEDRKKKEALAALEDKAREMGFSLAELTGTTAGRKRAATVAKYRNPEDHTQTWTGRGRKPRWYDAALKAGKTPDDMAI